MKKILKPQTREHAVYYSDFSGECFGEWGPPVEVIFEFNYGSEKDGQKQTFHLNNKEAQEALDFFKSRAIATKDISD